MQKLFDSLFALVQFLLPHHLLSRLGYQLARSRIGFVKNSMIRVFTQAFGVDLSEAIEQDAEAYPTFNEFFTRALRPDARIFPTDQRAVVSPVDGRIYSAGTIESDRLVQAKGRSFKLFELLGGDALLTDSFRNGPFVCVYLSPKDYHRVHMPITGTLRAMTFVPGRLFSVNAATTRTIPRLFARNERVICNFDTEAGQMTVILIGAMFVGSMETVWAGEITPMRGRQIRHWDYGPKGVRTVKLRRGEELGRFNMGSTVIVLFEQDRVAWSEDAQSGEAVRMGEEIGRTVMNESG